MKKIVIVFTVFILLLPAFAFSDLITFRVGYFIPRANSDLWQIELDNMDFTKTDFQDTVFGFTYEYFMTNQFSFTISMESYDEKKLGTYAIKDSQSAIMGNWVSDIIDDESWAFDYGQGAPISHVFTVSMTPISVGLKIAPMGRKEGLIPYFGGAASLYLFTVRIQGEMIDFSAPTDFWDLNLEEWVTGFPVIETDARVDNKLAFGGNVFAGIMFPIARRVSVEGEFKYHFAHGDISDTFIGFENFDLSGYQITVGVNYWF